MSPSINNTTQATFNTSAQIFEDTVDQYDQLIEELKKLRGKQHE